jgi:ribosomal protein S18 acetylase RimI-like enzyme
MNIVVRKTNKKERAFKIAKELPDSFDKNGLNLMKKDLENGELYGAYSNNEMIGFLCYRELNPEAIEVAWMAVLPVYQGKGVGTKLLMDSLKDFGNNYKVCEVKTLSETRPDTGYERTRRFYKKLGFIPLETIHPYPGWSKGNPCQIFVKFLKN